MKKFLVFLLGMTMILGIMGVFADPQEQLGEGNVVTDFSIGISPSPLLFGNMEPGDIKTLDTTFTGGQSDLQIEAVSVSNSTGSVFSDANLMFSTDGTTFESATDITAPSPILISNGASVILKVRLTIPTATKAESFSGKITYTIMEQP
ncbi:MAG: hypothetical protein RL557_868 [archaeon]|jgi:hypothetical protein